MNKQIKTKADWWRANFIGLQEEAASLKHTVNFRI